MKLPLCVVTPCEVHTVIRFLPTKTNQLLKFIGKCVYTIGISSIDIQLLYTEHNSLLNFNSWFVLGSKRNEEVCATTRHGSCIFNTAFCTFLWNDCYKIFTVLPETQKLYLLAISHWSAHKTRKKIGKLTFKTTLVFWKWQSAPNTVYVFTRFVLVL